ncbi:UNVERIFIED_CONTAM: hypothetical protein NCL1_26297 [Trichonephila clavipes]
MGHKLTCHSETQFLAFPPQYCGSFHLQVYGIATFLKEQKNEQPLKQVSTRQKFERSPTRERSMAFDRSHITSERDTSPRRHSSPRSVRLYNNLYNFKFISLNF